GRGCESVHPRGCPCLCGVRPAAQTASGRTDFLNARSFYAGLDGDAFAQKLIGVRPRTGIVIAHRRVHAKRDFEYVSALERGCAVEHGHAYTAGDVAHRCDVGSDELYLLDVEINRFCGGRVFTFRDAWLGAIGITSGMCPG